MSSAFRYRSPKWYLPTSINSKDALAGNVSFCVVHHDGLQLRREPVNYPVSSSFVFVGDKTLLFPRNILVIGDALTSTLKPSIRKGLARSLQNSFELSPRPDGRTPKEDHREQIIAKSAVIEGLFRKNTFLSSRSQVEVGAERSPHKPKRTT